MKNLNQQVISLINKYGDDYKSALRGNLNLECFTALSPLRENLLEWYSFREDADLLQAGADFGALTGLYTERVKAVDVWDETEESLDVVKARQFGVRTFFSVPLEDLIREGKSYDYVVSTGGMREPQKEWTENLKALVKPGGILILAACNYFGLKYMAGSRRDDVSVTRGELLKLFPGCTFYYPMPDYRFPSVIYSDHFLPRKGELSGMLPLYDFPQYTSTDIGAGFETACENGQFADFADSFLIFWKKGE